MEEKNLNFDKITDRSHTGSLKYDMSRSPVKDKDMISLWVADMDFPTSSFVIDAVKERTDHGIFGYTIPEDGYYDAVIGWMDRHFSFKPSKDWIVPTPGVVFALAMAVRALTKEGDGVLIQPPVYYPFREVIKSNKRNVIENVLLSDEEGRYYIDFEDFERKIKEASVKLFILCNPHNPVGRVWTKEELCRMADICLKHNVKIVSDEIHADFVFGDRAHTVLAGICEEYSKNVITCTAPSKTFNLAGLQISNIIISDDSIRRAFLKEMSGAGYSQVNTLGLTACQAAYEKGEEYYEALKEYIRGNIDFIYSFIEKELPQVKMYKPEGTYLVWLDCRRLGLPKDKLEELVTGKAGLWLDEGSIFGKSGEGFERINAACPRSILKEAMIRLKRAMC